jgi:hypothetical protein
MFSVDHFCKVYRPILMCEHSQACTGVTFSFEGLITLITHCHRLVSNATTPLSGFVIVFPSLQLPSRLAHVPSTWVFSPPLQLAARARM